MAVGQVTKHDRYCFINTSRGLGDMRWEIVKFDIKELTLHDPITKQKFNIYTALCYTTLESKRASIVERKAAASRIGLVKNKPGKNN